MLSYEVTLVWKSVHYLPKDGPLSEEHVIPSSLAGDLKCDFVCKPCNDFFGSTFEAKAKTDPAIRLAVANLHEELPAAIYQRIEDGQSGLSRAVLFLDARLSAPEN